MNKVTFVPAFFVPLYKDVKVKVSTGETKKGLLRREKEVKRTEVRREIDGWSDCDIDGERLANDLAKAVSELNREGYEVVSVTPITSGGYDFQHGATGVNSGAMVGFQYGYSFGYGYSFTSSLIVTSRKVTP